MDFERMLRYCAALTQNNDRTWFPEHHDWYDEARADFRTLLGTVRFAIAESAPSLSDDILYMEPKDWMYRIARDMRYYKELPPYNPSFRAYISRDRKSWLPIGYFLRVAPDSSCFGTGIWFEDTDSLNQVRTQIADEFDRFEAAAGQVGLPIEGDKLKRLPRGFEQYEDAPCAEWLKYKNMSVLHNFREDELVDFASFEQTVRSLVTDMEPLRSFWLDAATGKTARKSARDFYSL